MDESFGKATQPAARTGPTEVQLVSEADLSEFQDSAAARHLARIEADQGVVLRLAAEGFDGPAWRSFATLLIEYGYGVMESWVATGRIYAKCRSKGVGWRSFGSPDNGIPSDEAQALARDCVAEAIIGFRDKVLKTGRWNPGRGATLATFFIGACLLQFPNLYRTWLSDHQKLSSRISLDDGLLANPTAQLGTSDGPEAIVVGADATRRAIRTVLAPVKDPRNKIILLMTADDYSVREIADRLGLGERQVDARLFRARRKLAGEAKR